MGFLAVLFLVAMIVCVVLAFVQIDKYWAPNWFFGAAGCGLAFCICMGVVAGRQAEEFRKACEAKGGEVVVLRKQADICLKPDSVIKTEY
jgi:hypothetical protein